MKPEAGSGDVINSTCEDDRASTEKSKGRRHLYKEIERLMEENRLITAKLEETSAFGKIYPVIKITLIQIINFLNLYFFCRGVE